MAENGGNGNGRNNPWWVNAVAVVGVPSIIALLTVNWLLNTFSAELLKDQRQISESLQQTSALINELHDEFGKQDSDREEEKKQAKQLYEVAEDQRDLLAQYLDQGTHELKGEKGILQHQTLLQEQTCVNAAKSIYQARKCMESDAPR